MRDDSRWQRYWRYLSTRFRRDLADELTFHVEMRARQLEAEGLGPEEARIEAVRRFGDRQLVENELERIERKRGNRMALTWFVDELWQDVRYGIRGLLKRPGFTLMTTVSLGLGIAATTVVLSLVDSWMLRPLPVKNPGELVVIGASSKATAGMVGSLISLPTVKDIRARTDLFEDASAVQLQVVAIRRPETQQGERRIVLATSGSYFATLGVPAVEGRTFTMDDDAKRERVVVLANGYWRTHFAGDARAIGQTVYLNTVPFTVIGVAPPQFHGTEHMFDPDGYIPVGTAEQINPAMVGASERRDLGAVKVLARRRSGKALGEIRAALDVLGTQLLTTYPSIGEEYRMSAVPESRARPQLEVATATAAAAVVFSGLALLVLLAAGVNVTNLILARGSSRSGELLVRQALGASRNRLIRQLVTETVILAVIALVDAWILARIAVRGLTSIPINIAGGIPLNWGIALDLRIFAMVAVISVAVGLVVGLGPALVASRFDLQSGIRRDRGGPSRRAERARAALVVAQVAASVVVLVCAGLFASSVRQAAKVDLAFKPDHLLTVSFDAGLARYDEPTARRAFERIRREVEQISGVSSTALASSVPLDHGAAEIVEVFADGAQQTTKKGSIGIYSSAVSPEFFGIIDMPLLEGRAFTERDDSTAPRVAIVNHQAAEMLWPGQPAVGRVIRLRQGGPPVEIVGVAKTSRYMAIGEGPRPYLYLPLGQRYAPWVFLYVKTKSEPATVSSAVRQAAAVDRDLVPFGMNSLQELLETSPNGMLALRLGSGFATVIGVLAIALTIVGLYGVIAYSVSQRTREIGLRMALGEDRKSVIGSILRQGGTLAMVGIGIGLIVALLVSRLLAGLLVGVSATDVTVFSGVVLGLVVVTLGSAFIPARRASRIDPLAAIRSDG